MIIAAILVCAAAFFFFALYIAMSDFFISEFHALGLASWTGYRGAPPAEPKRTMSVAAGR